MSVPCSAHANTVPVCPHLYAPTSVLDDDQTTSDRSLHPKCFPLTQVCKFVLMVFAPGCQNAQLHSNKTDLMPLASFDFLPPKLLFTVGAVALGFVPEWGNKGPNNDSPYRGSIGAFPSTLELRKLKLRIKKIRPNGNTSVSKDFLYITKKFISYILGNLKEAYFAKLHFYAISMAQYVWTE